MVKTNLNIPATLVHSIKGKQYKVNGILLSINESNDTCSMKFRNRTIEHDIPMDKILINEGFIDKIKEYGLKVANYITLKVKGFLVLVDEATLQVMEWSLYNIANLAVKAVLGKLPQGVYFAPTASLKKTAGVNGMSIDEAFAASIAEDRKNIVNYWTRVINRTGSHEEETIEESIKYVNEHYYTTSAQYKSLNEGAVYSYNNIKNNKGQGEYGTSINSIDLKSLLTENILNQISGELGEHADEVPVLIWGAPGIGKTAIIKQVIKDMAHDEYDSVRLNLETIMLGGYTIENWTLPKNTHNDIQGVSLDRFKDNPKAWLPVYLHSDDPEERRKRDDFCNRNVFLSTNKEGNIVNNEGLPYEGGVVFMDEYSRVDEKVQKIIMGITNEHRFGDNYDVASKWGFVFAANRSVDDAEADSEDTRYYPVPAQINRFQHVTYEPSKEEWIAWARQKDKVTGEANVPPFIVDFIEAAKDHVWYSTIVNGGYDDMLDNPEADKRAHEEDDMDDSIQGVLDQPAIKKTKRMVTPRTWANVIGPAYKKELIRIFDHNSEGISGEDYYKKLIKDSLIISKNEDGEDVKDYYGGILPNKLIDALNDVDEGYWNHWVKTKGGERRLDPGHEYYGIKGRYNMFMAWFADMIRYKINDSTGTSAKNSTAPVIKAWDAYNSYTKIFTPDVINSIWTTGNMTKEYLKDDDRKPITPSEFINSENSKWKGSSSLCFNVCAMVFDGYPGDLASDMESDMEALRNAKKLSDSEVMTNALTLIDEYLFKVNGKKVNLLFDKKDLADIDVLRYKVNSLLNSKVAQYFAHFTSWLAKVTIQSELGNIAVDYEEKIWQLFNEIDSDIASEFKNQKAVKKATNAAKADKTNKALIHLREIEEAKTPILPAIIILHRAKSYEWESMRNK